MKHFLTFMAVMAAASLLMLVPILHFSKQTAVPKTEPKPLETKWYGGEILISIITNNTNYNAKINNMELGLRSDGVLVYRTNNNIIPPTFNGH